MAKGRRRGPGNQNGKSGNRRQNMRQESMEQHSGEQNSMEQQSMDQRRIDHKPIDRQSSSEESTDRLSMDQQHVRQKPRDHQSSGEESTDQQSTKSYSSSRRPSPEPRRPPDYSVQETPMRPQSMKRPQRYFPKPYTFRIPIPSGGWEVPTEGIVKSPPFYLQLDHTLAVIWSLFCKDEMDAPLGIAQMQWALLFLKGIYNRKGQHPKDIEICIEAIQDQLIDQYASLMDEPRIGAYVVKSASSGGHERRGYRLSSSSLHDSGLYGSSRNASNLHISSHFGIEQRRPGPKPNDGCCGGDSHGYNAAKGRSGGIRWPSMQQLSVLHSEESFRRRSFQNTLSPSDDTFSRQIPFSINYAEMSQRQPKDVEHLLLRPCARRSYIEEERLATPKNIFSVSRLGANGSKSRDFLKTIRQEQLSMIKAELKTLNLIEDYMETSEHGRPESARTPSSDPRDLPAPLLSGLPPPTSGRASPREQITPTKQIPTRGQTSPTGQVSSRGQTTPTRQTLPQGQMTPTEQISPKGETTPTVQISPRKQMTPTEQISPRGQTSPRRQTSPRGQISPREQMSPREHMSPTRQDYPTGQMSPTRQAYPTGEDLTTGRVSSTGQILLTEQMPPTKQVNRTGQVSPTEQISRMSPTEQRYPTRQVHPTEEMPPLEQINPTGQLHQTGQVSPTGQMSQTEVYQTGQAHGTGKITSSGQKSPGGQDQAFPSKHGPPTDPNRIPRNPRSTTGEWRGTPPPRQDNMSPLGQVSSTGQPFPSKRVPPRGSNRNQGPRNPRNTNQRTGNQSRSRSSSGQRTPPAQRRNMVQQNKHLISNRDSNHHPGLSTSRSTASQRSGQTSRSQSGQRRPPPRQRDVLGQPLGASTPRRGKSRNVRRW